MSNQRPVFKPKTNIWNVIEFENCFPLEERTGANGTFKSANFFVKVDGVEHVWFVSEYLYNFLTGIADNLQGRVWEFAKAEAEGSNKTHYSVITEAKEQINSWDAAPPTQAAPPQPQKAPQQAGPAVQQQIPQPPPKNPPPQNRPANGTNGAHAQPAPSRNQIIDAGATMHTCLKVARAIMEDVFPDIDSQLILGEVQRLAVSMAIDLRQQKAVPDNRHIQEFVAVMKRSAQPSQPAPQPQPAATGHDDGLPF